MVKSGIEIETLIDVTLNYMRLNKLNIDQLDDSKPSKAIKNRETNHWYKLAKEYYKKDILLEKDILNIFSWWKRDTANYRSQVISRLEKQLIKKCSSSTVIDTDYSDSILSNIIEKEFVLKEEDFLKIRSFIINKKRPVLNYKFTSFLSSILQQNGINCWLKNKHNYLRKLSKLIRIVTDIINVQVIFF
jgi:hypothetical protein